MPLLLVSQTSLIGLTRLMRLLIKRVLHIKLSAKEAAQTSTIFARYADSIVPGEATIGGYINFDKTNDIPSLIDKFNELSDSTKRTGVVYDAFMNEVAMSPHRSRLLKQIDNGSASMQGLEKYCTDTGKG